MIPQQLKDTLTADALVRVEDAHPNFFSLVLLQS
jgi:hypothetical protein